MSVRTEREQAAYDRSYRIGRVAGYAILVPVLIVFTGLVAHGVWNAVALGWRLGQ